jgi:hypothetical protein
MATNLAIDDQLIEAARSIDYDAGYDYKAQRRRTRTIAGTGA